MKFDKRLFIILATLLITRYLPFQLLKFYEIWNNQTFLFHLAPSAIEYFLTVIIIADVLNVYLMYKLGETYHSKNAGILTSLVYVLSNWILYLLVGSSLNIIIVSLFSVILISLKKVAQGPIYKILLVISVTGILLFSLKSFFFAALFIVFYINKTQKKFRTVFLVAALSLIFFYVLLFRGGFKVNVRNDMKILFSQDVINNVNEFRGILIKENLPVISKLIDNKYFYLTRVSVSNMLNLVNPSNYFTQQYPILGFSYAQPIYLILLVPFLYSMYFLIKKISISSLLKIMAVLIPLSLANFDLVSLAVISPIIFLIIAIGMSKLSRHQKIWVLVLVILFLQTVASFADMANREQTRYVKYVQENNLKL